MSLEPKRLGSSFSFVPSRLCDSVKANCPLWAQFLSTASKAALHGAIAKICGHSMCVPDANLTGEYPGGLLTTYFTYSTVGASSFTPTLAPGSQDCPSSSLFPLPHCICCSHSHCGWAADPGPSPPAKTTASCMPICSFHLSRDS